MPIATTSGKETEKFELKTLEGAYVVIRKLTYGEYLSRRQMTSNMKVEGGGKGRGLSGVMELMNRHVTEFEFSNCITDHNLEDENGEKLNFKKPAAINRLDPKVGEEISVLIGKVNNFDEEDEDELGN